MSYHRYPHREATDDEIKLWLNEPMAFIENVLILEDGRSYGEAMERFQRNFFEAVFAVLPDRRPKHRLIYDERVRGASKTEDCAAAAIADLVTGPRGTKLYAVAGDVDQASLIVDSILGFADRSPLVNAILKVDRFRVRNEQKKSELRVMSSDDRTAYGIRPRKTFFDELSLQPDDRLWIPFWSASAKRRDGQVVAVTMAGFDFVSVCWKVRTLAQSKPDYFFQTQENAPLPPWLSAEQMEEQRASLHPSDFARFWECRWVEPKGSWISKEIYDAAETGREAIAAADERQRSVGFVDVGLVRDATAVAVCHREEDRVVLDTMATLQGTRDAPVELEVLEDLVLDLTARFHVAKWVFEAPQAVASVQRLQRRLGSTSVTARYPTAETQAKLFGTLYMLFANGRLVLFPHEQLRKEALSLVTKTVGGRLKVVESSAVHQDHVIALGGAAELAISGAGTSTADWVGVFAEANRGLTSRNLSRPELGGGGYAVLPKQDDFEPAGRREKREIFDEPGHSEAGPIFIQPTTPSKWRGAG